MSMKISSETLNDFKNNLSKIEKFNAKDLIRRDELGAELNFANAEEEFETAINLFKGLLDIDIMRVPESKIQALNNYMQTFIDYINEIKNFSATQGPNEHQRLINNITAQYDAWFRTISPIVAYCTKAGTDHYALQRHAQECYVALRELQNEATTNMKEKDTEAQNLLTSMKSAANKVGVAQHSTNFENAAEDFSSQKRFWMRWIFGTGITIIAYSFAFFLCYPVTLEEPYFYHFLQLALPRFTGLIVLFSWLIICSKNYRAQAHNYIINKNKQNALSTFETFVNATNNEEIRNAVLLQTTKAIFSNSPSGYLKENISENDPTQIIEIVKDMSKVMGN